MLYQNWGKLGGKSKLGKIQETRTISRFLKSSCLAFAVFLMAFLFVPYLATSANAATEVSTRATWLPITLTLDTGGNVSFGDIVPTEADSENEKYGTMKVAKRTVTVESTGKAAAVYLSMASNKSNSLEYNGDSDSIFIPAASGSWGTPAKLNGKGWGYSVPSTANNPTAFTEEGDFTFRSMDAGTVSDSLVPGDTNYNGEVWAAVPENSQTSEPQKIWSYTIASGSVDEDFDIYYAVMADTSLVSGEYKNSIVYTAVSSSDSLTEVSNNINVSNTTTSGTTSGTKRYTAKGDVLRLNFDLAQDPTGVDLIDTSKVKAYLVPHATVAGAGYTITGAIESAAESGAYPVCDISEVTIERTSTAGATIICTVGNSGVTPEVVKTTATTGTGTSAIYEASDGYYDIWVRVPFNSTNKMDYISRYDGGGHTVATLAFAGLQSHSDGDESSTNYVVDAMQDMTSSVCKNTNKWANTVGEKAIVNNYDGSAITAISGLSTDLAKAEASNALGVGTFALTDSRDSKKYLVRRLADGNCWMVQNLDYDLTVSTNRSLKEATSDITEDKTLSTGWDLDAQIGSACTEQYQTYTKHGGDCLWGSLKDTGEHDGDPVAAANNARSAFARSYNNHSSNEYRYVATAQYDKGTGYVQYAQYSDNNKTMATKSFTPTKKGSSDNGDVPTTDGNGNDPSYSSFADGVYYGNMYIGTYYNWYAATAETNGTADLTYHTYYNGSTPTGSICPKGWQLPVNSANANSDYTDKSWSKLIKGAYDLIGEDGGQTAQNSKFPNASDPTKEASLRMHQLPLSIVFSGYYYWTTGALSSRGYGGGYWSSTPNGNGNAYYLYFNATGVYPRSYNSKPYGFTVRCVAR